jgi:hypothetical protein
LFEVHTLANPKSTSDWLVKKKRVVIAPKRPLRSNKQRLLSLNAYPRTFSQRIGGVITDETWHYHRRFRQL